MPMAVPVDTYSKASWEFPKIEGPNMQAAIRRDLITRTPIRSNPQSMETAKLRQSRIAQVHLGEGHRSDLLLDTPHQAP